MLEKELGTLFAKLPVFFPYLRTSAERRKFFRRRKLYNQFRSELRRYARKGKKMPEKDKEKYMKAIREVD